MQERDIENLRDKIEEAIELLDDGENDGAIGNLEAALNIINRYWERDSDPLDFEREMRSVGVDHVEDLEELNFHDNERRWFE